MPSTFILLFLWNFVIYVSDSSNNSLNRESLDQESSTEKQLLENGTANGVANGSPSSVHDDKIADVITHDNELLQPVSAPAEEEKCKSWKEWFKTPFFYKVTI